MPAKKNVDFAPTLEIYHYVNNTYLTYNKKLDPQRKQAAVGIKTAFVQYLATIENLDKHHETTAFPFLTTGLSKKNEPIVIDIDTRLAVFVVMLRAIQKNNSTLPAEYGGVELHFDVPGWPVSTEDRYSQHWIDFIQAAIIAFKEGMPDSNLHTWLPKATQPSTTVITSVMEDPIHSPPREIKSILKTSFPTPEISPSTTEVPPTAPTTAAIIPATSSEETSLPTTKVPPTIIPQVKATTAPTIKPKTSSSETRLPTTPVPTTTTTPAITPPTKPKVTATTTPEITRTIPAQTQSTMKSQNGATPTPQASLKRQFSGKSWAPKKLDSLLAELDIMYLYGREIAAEDAEKSTAVKRLAIDLYTDIKKYYQSRYRPTPQEKQQFINDFHEKLHSKDELMSKHRGRWKVIVANVALAFTGIGLLAIGISLLARGHGFFNETKSQQLVNGVGEQLNNTISVR